MECFVCNRHISYRDGCDKDVCCYCEGNDCVPLLYVQEKYNKSDNIVSIQYYGFVHVDFCKYYEHLQTICTDKHILDEALIECRARNMAAYLKREYHNTVIRRQMFGFKGYKFNQKRHQTCYKFKYEDIFFDRIAEEYNDTNNKIIEDYAYSLESDESVKSRLKENHDKYCNIFEKLKHVTKCIFNIIEKDLDTLEKISSVIGIKIDILQKNNLHKILDILNIEDKLKDRFNKFTENNDIISAFQYLAKQSEHISEILNKSDIIDLTTENEIRKSGIMDDIYLNLIKN